MSRTIVLAVVVLGIHGAIANAAPITWQLSGTMYSGTPFEGLLTFETTTPDTLSPNDERSLYYRAITNLSFKIADARFRLATAPLHNEIDVRYALTWPNPVGDSLLVHSDVVSAKYSDALTLSLHLTFFDPSDDWLTHGRLPPLLPFLPGLSQKTLMLRYQGPDGVVRDQMGDVETFAPIPEPATGVLLLGGLVSAGLSQFRKRRARR